MRLVKLHLNLIICGWKRFEMPSAKRLLFSLISWTLQFPCKNISYIIFTTKLFKRNILLLCIFQLPWGVERKLHPLEILHCFTMIRYFHKRFWDSLVAFKIIITHVEYIERLTSGLLCRFILLVHIVITKNSPIKEYLLRYNSKLAHGQVCIFVTTIQYYYNLVIQMCHKLN